MLFIFAAVSIAVPFAHGCYAVPQLDSTTGKFRSSLLILKHEYNFKMLSPIHKDTNSQVPESRDLVPLTCTLPNVSAAQRASGFLLHPHRPSNLGTHRHFLSPRDFNLFHLPTGRWHSVSVWALPKLAALLLYISGGTGVAWFGSPSWGLALFLHHQLPLLSQFWHTFGSCLG